MTKYKFMKLEIVFLFTIGIMFSYFNFCFASCFTPLYVKYDLPKAGFVIKGEVIDIKKYELLEFPSGVDQRCVAVFRIERIIKGRGLSPNDEIMIEFCKPVGGFHCRSETLSKGECCIVFLKKRDDKFEFFRDVQSKLPARKGKSPVSFGNTPEKIMLEELVNNFYSQKRQSIILTLHQLIYLQSKEVYPYVKELENLVDPLIKGMVIGTLISLGDFSYIDKAVDFLEREKDLLPKRGEGFGVSKYFVEEGILTGIEHIGNLPNRLQAVPQLNPLLKHSYTHLRKRVVHLLRRLKHSSSIPYFIDALDDIDIDVRYNAMMAVAEITGKVGGMPAKHKFLENEKEYINHWKEWWKKEGKFSILPVTKKCGEPQKIFTLLN